MHAAEILPISETELIEEENIKTPDINELLHDGQTITVQVIKDEIGTKGARLTTHLTIPSHFLVMMPDNNHIGVSQRIEDEEERKRLKQILLQPEKSDSKADEPGYIVRTAAEGAQEDELRRDVNFLNRLWQTIKSKIRKAKAPCLVHEDLDLTIRLIRDLIPTDVEKIRVDSEAVHAKLLSFVDDFIPALNLALSYTMVSGLCSMHLMWKMKSKKHFTEKFN